MTFSCNWVRVIIIGTSFVYTFKVLILQSESADMLGYTPIWIPSYPMGPPVLDPRTFPERVNTAC